MIYLDTHVVVWLYAGETERFPDGAKGALEKNDLGISPTVLLELRYLQEIKRVIEEAHVIVERLAGSVGLQVVNSNYLPLIQEAVRQDWTRDPFDRLIVAQAVLDGCALLTKDGSIRKHYALAFWESLPGAT